MSKSSAWETFGSSFAFELAGRLLRADNGKADLIDYLQEDAG
jgi:hypothetical protein